MKQQRLIALFFLGLILFSQPIMGLFGRDLRLWLGVPTYFLYIFAAWLLFIVLLGIVAERSSEES